MFGPCATVETAGGGRYEHWSRRRSNESTDRIFDSASAVEPAWLTLRERYHARFPISQRFETVRIGEFTTPPRVCGGVLVDKPASRDGGRADRAKSRDSKGLRHLRPEARALFSETRHRHPDPNPGGSDRQSTPTLSNSHPLWLTTALFNSRVRIGPRGEHELWRDPARAPAHAALRPDWHAATLVRAT